MAKTIAISARTGRYSEQRTNGLANWYWAANAVALVVAQLAVHPDTGYYTFAWLFIAIGVFGGLAYAPWMASFTETVEKHNPAATATGLAVWGWILRIVVACSAAFVPLVVTSVTPIVEHGHEVKVASEQAAPALAVMNKHSELFAELGRYPEGQAPPELQTRAAREVGLPGLAAVQKAQLKVLKEHGAEVKKASEDGPGQWRTWWYV
jgi:hypothetical protein